MGTTFLALLSGIVGALGAQLLSIWHTRRLERERTTLNQQLERERQMFELQRVKLEILRKIAGNRSAATDSPIDGHLSAFFQGLNEVMVVFSDSKDVSRALVDFKSALRTPNQKDQLTSLFKSICVDVGIDPHAFNDSLFLEPFSLGKKN